VQAGPAPVARTLPDLRRFVAEWRATRETVALVPTMGALHTGHLTLVRQAKARCTRAVVSIFVNPTQFGPNEDFTHYPRDEAADLEKLASVGADVVWAPHVGEMYPEGFSTRVEPDGAALGLEGEFRPHHFSGVATICTKLFSQATPDIALFGEKDYQQLCVIRQTVRDLNLPLRIVGVDTVREADGLALSSRNRYLSDEERAIAPTLNRSLRSVAEAVRSGINPEAVCEAARASLLSAGFARVDYVAVRDAETLAPVSVPLVRPARVLAAATLGKTRLIDNVPVEAPAP